jgi:ribose transport system substrate-binding protein
MIQRRPPGAVGAVALLSALALAACGAGSSGASGTTAPSSAAPSSAAPAASDSAGAQPSVAASAGGDAVAAAKDIIAPYTGKPSAFPIDTPLDKKPTGKRIAYFDCGTPICGLFFQLAEPAAKQLGMTMTSLKAGLKPDTVQAAFDTAVQDKYDAVFVPAIPPQLWQRGLEQLRAAKIPVATSGVVGADKSYVKVQQAGDVSAALAGKLMAAQVVASKADQANAVLYYTPELPFQAVIRQSFLAEYKALCAACTVRDVKVSAGTFGTTASQVIVDDLQANPKTNYAVFGIGEQARGLPSALKTAGITVDTLVNSPDPANLADLQKGLFTVGLGLDLPVVAWTIVDSLARQVQGEEPSPGAVADAVPQQFLTKADLTGDVSRGWTAYPDFADRFGKLWASAK